MAAIWTMVSQLDYVYGHLRNFDEALAPAPTTMQLAMFLDLGKYLYPLCLHTTRILKLVPQSQSHGSMLSSRSTHLSFARTMLDSLNMGNIHRLFPRSMNARYY